MKLYGLEKIGTVEEFLGAISRSKGMLKSGGIPNFDQAARTVIKDYLDGKMKYFTPAPHCEGLDTDE